MSKDFWKKMDEFDCAAEKAGGYVASTKLTEKEIQELNREVRKQKVKNRRTQSKSDEQVYPKDSYRLDFDETKGLVDRR